MRIPPTPQQFLSTMLLAATLLLAGCPKEGPATRTSTAPAATSRAPMLLAAYQPWFGRPGHIDVGYSTSDRVVLQRQINEAKAQGIEGFVVNWYGVNKTFEDQSYSLLQQLAATSDFKVALMYDEPDRVGDTTEEVIADLQYAHSRYFGPNATARAAYLMHDGRPVVFIFPKRGDTDWSQVREAIRDWNPQPLMIMKDINPKYVKDFEGFYAWVQPGNKGWAPDGSNWGREYLENFYSRMKTRHPSKIAVGAAWPGFDDSKASWSRNRKIDARCGKTWQDTFNMHREFYRDGASLPYLMIVTWNDYEEGTAIERGLPRC